MFVVAAAVSLRGDLVFLLLHTPMPSLQDIPVDLFLDNLLPCFSLPELAHIAATNRFFSTLVDDDIFWKRKLLADFNFDPSTTARTSGLKFIYRGLHKPRLFVWGCVISTLIAI